MKPPFRIAVSSPSFCKSPLLLDELKSLGLPCTLNTEGVRFNEEELIDFINFNQATVLIVGLEAITKTVLESCPSLQFIAKYGVGLDNLDLEAMKAHQIPLGWTGGVNRRSVSELALGFMLGHCRNIVPSVLNLKENKWIKNGGRQLSDCTVGIVGFGNIGTDLAMLLKPFGTKVVYTDIVDRSVPAKEHGASFLNYTDLLKTSDIVTFHVPSTPLTRNMLDHDQLQLLKKDALVINTARGDILNFEATCQAVKDGRLGGFGCDVFPEEPCVLTEWASLQTLYFTPHMGGNAKEAVLAMGRSALHHVREFVKG